MVLPNFVDRARSGQPLRVHDDGQQCRSFGDVGTFIDCLLRLVELPQAWVAETNPINIGSTTMTSIRALAEMVKEETESTSTIEHVPYESEFPGKRDVRFRCPDTSRLESLLGVVKWRDLRAVVRDYIAAA